MKPRTGFWIWAMMVFVLLVLQHTKLRPFPHILLLFWLLLPLGSLAHLLLARKQLTVRFHGMGEFERSARFPVRMQAENLSRFSVQSLWTQDGPDTVRLLVEPASNESVQFLADSPHIGAYALPDRPVYLDEPFGLFRLPVVPEPSNVWILPFELQNLTGHAEGQQGQSPRTAPFQDGRDETAYVEAHTRGKPMRHIHWKLSARMQQWLTRHMDDETDPTLLLVVLGPDADTGASRDKKDRMYDYAYTLAKATLTGNHPLRLFSNGQPTEVYSRPEQSRMVRRLLSMQAEEPVPSKKILRNVRSASQAVVVLVDTLDEAAENELLALRGRVHRLTAVLFEEPEAERAGLLRASRIDVIISEDSHEPV